jgi:hypothetical protein
MSTRTKHVEHSDDIDLTTWTFFNHADPDLGTLTLKQIAKVQSVVTTVLRQEFAESPPRLGFPAQYGPKEDGYSGPAVSDPVTMYVGASLGRGDDQCVYSISLEDVVDEVIGDLGRNNKVYDPPGQNICRKIAVRLRELAAKLESACVDEAAPCRQQQLPSDPSQIPITDIEWPPNTGKRILNICRQHPKPITTLGAMSELSEGEWLRTLDLGAKSIAVIKRVLAEHGLKMGANGCLPGHDNAETLVSDFFAHHPKPFRRAHLLRTCTRQGVATVDQLIKQIESGEFLRNYNVGEKTVRWAWELLSAKPYPH